VLGEAPSAAALEWPRQGALKAGGPAVNGEYRRVKVLIETSERSFRGYLSVPCREGYRLSDYLNDYDKQFMCLAEVEMGDRGQHWRVGEKLTFAAVAVESITLVTPLEEG
jgi:hypothetical protein